MTPFITLPRLRGTPARVNVMAISYLVPLSNGCQVQFADHSLLVSAPMDEVELAIARAFEDRFGSRPDPDDAGEAGDDGGALDATHAADAPASAQAAAETFKRKVAQAAKGATA